LARKRSCAGAQAAPQIAVLTLEAFGGLAADQTATLTDRLHVQLAIYDLRGQRVALLVDERQAAGQHSAVRQAQEHSSGVYFIRLQAGGLLQVHKAVLMK
jgi:hypothetical protein